ncbi:hypothetical protein BD413DRAFT_245632 [Trametes elegans]|nr:hypothetical protein BD413DRAFT_245632 [Trametes elegans]
MPLPGQPVSLGTDVHGKYLLRSLTLSLQVTVLRDVCNVQKATLAEPLTLYEKWRIIAEYTQVVVMAVNAVANVNPIASAVVPIHGGGLEPAPLEASPARLQHERGCERRRLSQPCVLRKGGFCDAEYTRRLRAVRTGGGMRPYMAGCGARIRLPPETRGRGRWISEKAPPSSRRRSRTPSPGRIRTSRACAPTLDTRPPSSSTAQRPQAVCIFGGDFRRRRRRVLLYLL